MMSTYKHKAEVVMEFFLKGYSGDEDDDDGLDLVHRQNDICERQAMAMLAFLENGHEEAGLYHKYFIPRIPTLNT